MDAKAPVLAEEKENNSPMIELLEKIDQEYIDLQTQLNNAMKKMRIEFTKKVAPILAKRKEALSGDSKSAEGTPALPSFWSTVENSAWKIRRSNITPSERPLSKARFTLSLAPITASWP